jgi:hypothetical protein
MPDSATFTTRAAAQALIAAWAKRDLARVDEMAGEVDWHAQARSLVRQAMARELAYVDSVENAQLALAVRRQIAADRFPSAQPALAAPKPL